MGKLKLLKNELLKLSQREGNSTTYWGYKITDSEFKKLCKKYNLEHHHTAKSGGSVRLADNESIQVYNGHFGSGLVVHSHMVNGTRYAKYQNHWIDYYIFED